MGFRCIVSCCRARYKKESSLSFYQLPKDEKMKEQWFSILEINNLKFTSVARICSRHFTDESFIPRHFGRGRSLRADAVPTLYIGDNKDNRIIRTKKKFTSPNIISARRQPNIIPVCKQTNDCDENEIHSDAEDNPSAISKSELLENDSRHAEELTSNTVIISDISLKNSKNLPRRRRYFEGDFSIEDMDSPKTARFYFQQARNRISQLQSQIQMLKKRNKRLNDKNLKLLVIIEKLKPNNENLSDEKSEQNNPDITIPVQKTCEPRANIKQETEIFRYVASIPDESTSLPVNDNEQENMNKIFRYVAANSIDIDKSSCNAEQEAKNVIYRYIFSDSDHDYCT